MTPTPQGPGVAPAGTVAVMIVSDTTVNGAGSVGKLHESATWVAPVRWTPLMVTTVPTGPKVGLIAVILGQLGGTFGPVTVKLGGASDPQSGEPTPTVVVPPPGVVTMTLLVATRAAAPGGTVAEMVVSEITVNRAEIALNLTQLAPLKLVPVMVTVVPSGPLAGLMPVITGGGDGGA